MSSGVLRRVGGGSVGVPRFSLALLLVVPLVNLPQIPLATASFWLNGVPAGMSSPSA